MSHLVLVVPCYNEALRLDVEAFARFGPGGLAVELLFVNDGSRDATLERLHAVQAAKPETTRILNLPANRGKAEAVRLGLLAALESEPDAVGFWDADLATPLAEVRELYDVLDRHGSLAMVIGSRVKLQGRLVERSEFRHYAGRVFATVVALLLRLPIYDTQCGAKLFRVTPVLEAALERPFVSRWIFDVELIARFMAVEEDRDVTSLVYEVPLHEWRDRPESKVGLRGYLRSIVDLARLCRAYRLPRAAGSRPRYIAGPRNGNASAQGANDASPER